MVRSDRHRRAAPVGLRQRIEMLMALSDDTGNSEQERRYVPPSHDPGCCSARRGTGAFRLQRQEQHFDPTDWITGEFFDTKRSFPANANPSFPKGVPGVPGRAEGNGEGQSATAAAIEPQTAAEPAPAAKPAPRPQAPSRPPSRDRQRPSAARPVRASRGSTTAAATAYSRPRAWQTRSCPASSRVAERTATAPNGLTERAGELADAPNQHLFALTNVAR